ncbi:MAG: hypothetical protein ACREJ3_05865 [Polyangiaceae bacterium]
MTARSAAFFLAAFGVAACSGATGEVQGGAFIFDAGVTAPPSTGGSFADAGPVTWSELYTSFFGPSAPATCTANSSCHGALGDLGAQGSGYVCGATKDSCYAGMTASIVQGFPPLIPDGGSNSPKTTVLYQALHVVGGSGGIMPLNGPDGGAGYEFTQADLTRIGAWLYQGAKDN